MKLIDKLRKMSADAQRNKEIESERQADEERRIADEIIAGIPAITVREANDGKTFAAIMQVTFGGRPDFFQEVDHGISLPPEHLTGPSKMVFNYCASEEFKTSLVGHWTHLSKRQHRVDFVLVVSW